MVLCNVIFGSFPTIMVRWSRSYIVSNGYIRFKIVALLESGHLDNAVLSSDLPKRILHQDKHIASFKSDTVHPGSCM